MEKKQNKYTFKRKVFGVLVIISLTLAILSFLLSQTLRNDVVENININPLLKNTSFGCLFFTWVFLWVEIKTLDKEIKEQE